MVLGLISHVMAVSLSAKVRDRRRRRDNYTDREGPQSTSRDLRIVTNEGRLWGRKSRSRRKG